MPGGEGGEPFVIQPSSKNVFVIRITLRSGIYVDSIGLMYSDGSTHQVGGEGGTPLELMLDFKNAEFIAQMEGRSGDYVDALRFTTSTGRVIQGGGTGGEAFAYPSHGQVFGFSGRAGIYVDAIQPSWATPPIHGQVR